jgi:hypothetical protein
MFTAVRRALVCVIKLDREELGRTQEARCCAHLSLAHFRFKRPTDLVQLSLHILELTSEL